MTYADRVKETTTTTGTGTIALGGAATGYRTFASALPAASTVPYCIQAGGEWEVGIGTMGTGTLARTTVMASSNSGALVNFSAGTKEVFCAMSADVLQRGIINPDDMGFDIVLCIGQSNMAGRGTYDSLIDVADPRVWQRGGFNGDARNGTIFSGADPLHMVEAVETGSVGPATWFAKAYASTIPTNRRVLLVPAAQGGTTLVAPTPQWAPGTPGGSLYENAIAAANDAVTKAIALYPNSRFVGSIWIQGESDADNGVTQAAYVSALKTLIAGIRTRVTGAASSWFVIGGMVPEQITGNAAYGVIDLAHKQVAAETNKCAFVAGPSGYQSGVHYLAGGVRILGSRMGLAVKAASLYSAADTIAPTAASASVANATPTIVAIAMTEAMDTGFVPAASAFTVSGHTVSSVAVIGSAINLTVTPAFVNGETCTVAYTQQGSNQARDLAGNLLPNFTSLAITDNVAAAASAVTMTGPTSGVNGVASSNFTLGVSPTGGTITGAVVVTPSDGGAGGTFTPTTRSLTTGSPTGTFTYTPASTGAKTISVTNNGGLSNPSNITYTVSAAATVPGAPTIGTATAGDASASVTFTAPASNGGSAITGYTVTSSPGSITATGPSSPITVTGLNNATAYTFTVTATNAIGTGTASAASNSVTPASAATYATWNPSDKHANLTLSNSNLTVTAQVGSPAGFQSLRSDVSKSSGKWYWESTIATVPTLIGVGNSTATLSDYAGSGADSVGYYSPGNIYRSGSGNGSPTPYTNGDVIGIALDMDAKTVTFYKNNVPQGTVTGLTGAVFAMGTAKDGSPPGSWTTNFGASAFAYTPPSGHVGLSS
jgi:hypothetical protein